MPQDETPRPDKMPEILTVLYSELIEIRALNYTLLDLVKNVIVNMGASQEEINAIVEEHLEQHRKAVADDSLDLLSYLSGSDKTPPDETQTGDAPE